MAAYSTTAYFVFRLSLQLCTQTILAPIQGAHYSKKWCKGTKKLLNNTNLPQEKFSDHHKNT